MTGLGKNIQNVLLILIIFTILVMPCSTIWAEAACSLPLPDYPQGTNCGNCWDFANLVYSRYWGYSFTSSQYTNDNLIQNVPIDAASRKATAANLKKYIYDLRIPKGSVIRFSRTLSYVTAASDGDLGHSIIIADYDANGFYAYHSRTVAGQYKAHYEYISYNSLANDWTLAGGLAYKDSFIKYIKAGTGTPVETPKVLTIGNANYPIYKKAGSTFTVNGTISSPNPITGVTVWINRADKDIWAGEGEYYATYGNGSGTAKSWSINNADGNMQFSKLAAGNYRYLIFARDSKGYEVMLDKPFTVGSGATSSGTTTVTGRHNHTLYAAYSWDAGVVTKQPTAASTGIRIYTCYCGATKTETIPKLQGYTVTYNANGGSGAPSAQTKTAGQPLTLRTAKPTRTGYVFLGWADSADANVSAYSAGSRYTRDADITLYAVWRPVRYTVVYDANGGSGSVPPQEMRYDAPAPLSSVCFTRPGYVQSHWALSPDANEAYPYVYSPGEELWKKGWNFTEQDGAGVTLYAVWKKAAITSPVYTVNTAKKTVSGFAADTTTETFLAGLEPTGLVLFRNGSVYTGQYAGTGLTVEYRLGGKTVDALSLVLTGDVNGDGHVTATDYLLVKRDVLELSALNGLYAQAADMTGDGKCTAADYLRLKRAVLNL